MLNLRSVFSTASETYHLLKISTKTFFSKLIDVGHSPTDVDDNLSDACQELRAAYRG
jgi:hypothetical protein